MSDIDEDTSTPTGGQRERRKIEIKFIENKTRRHVTFSKRKHGIMKKAFELSVLTGTQVLLLVVSETGLVYTFSTPKFEPIVTQQEGRNLIQACLNAPDDDEEEEEEEFDTSMQQGQQSQNQHQEQIAEQNKQPHTQKNNAPMDQQHMQVHQEQVAYSHDDKGHVPEMNGQGGAPGFANGQDMHLQQQGKGPNQYNHYLNEEQNSVYQQYFQDQQAHYG